MAELAELSIPSHEECYQILRDYQVPDRVVKHVEVVNRIAVFLAQKLREAGVDIDVELVDRASLLHDLDGVMTKGEHRGVHGEVAEQILINKGYPQIARIVKNHVYWCINKDGLSWEEKVVNYADKRGMANVVSMQERLDYFHKRYKTCSDGEEALARKTNAKLFEVEREIFSKLDFEPSDLKSLINLR
ncbi:MAG: HD domain-containing protein [Candidatus Woesearchaeota archaeon]